MSFARFGHDSDVYVYATDTGYECCGCRMNHNMNQSFATRRLIVRHLHVHQSIGHAVPEYTIRQIAIWDKEEKQNR